VAREQRHGHQHADQAAMKRHAPLLQPDRKQRVGKPALQRVEQHVAHAAAHHDADHAPEHQVAGLYRRDRPVPCMGSLAKKPPAGRERQQVADAVPVNLEQAEIERNRIEIDKKMTRGHGRLRRTAKCLSGHCKRAEARSSG